MADPSHSPGTSDDGQESGPGGTGGSPPWVVIVGIVVVAILLGLIVFLHLSGAIGPGIH